MGGGWCAAPAVSRAVREGQDRLWSHSVLRESRVAEVRREVRVAVGTSAVRVAGSGARAVLLLREVLRVSRMRAAYESGGGVVLEGANYCVVVGVGGAALGSVGPVVAEVRAGAYCGKVP